MAKDQTESSKKRKAEEGNTKASGSKKARFDKTASIASSSTPHKSSKHNDAGRNTSGNSNSATGKATTSQAHQDNAASRPEGGLSRRQRREQAKTARIAGKRGEDGAEAELKSHATQEAKEADVQLVDEGEAERLRQAQLVKKAAKRKARLERHKDKVAADKPAGEAEHAEEPSAESSARKEHPPPKEGERRRQKKLAKKARRGAEKSQSDGTLAVSLQRDAHQPGWSLSKPSGGRFMEQDPIFVQDPESGEEFIVAATSREIQLLSVETSLLVRSRELPGGRQVTAFALACSENHKSIHIMARDRTYFTWEWASEAPVQAANSTPNPVLALTDAVGAGLFYVVDMGSRTAVCHGERALFSTPRRLQSLQVLGEADYIVAQGRSGIILGKKKDGKHERQDYHWIELPIGKEIFCFDARLASSRVAARQDPQHNQVLSVAIGVEEGQILLFDDIGSAFGQQGQPALPTPRTLHWHREAPSAVKFNKDGNYLISGGKETVLLLWQLETGNKQTLPHLTSEIERITVSPAGDKYAMQMGDNSIMVLSTSELKPVANFAGLQCEVPVRRAGKKLAPAGSRVMALLHPSQQDQLLLTVPSSQPKSLSPAAVARPFVQTFDIRTSRHITRQALTRNNVTDFNLGPEQTPIAPPDVAHLAVSHDGKWLATVDDWMPPACDVEFAAKDNGGNVEEQRLRRREVYIKFWQWDETQSLWTLSTRVDAPYARVGAGKGIFGAGPVLQLIADPSNTGFATAGEDGSIKLWRPRTKMQNGVAMKTDSNVEIMEWVCRRTIGLPLPGQEQRADSPLEMPGPDRKSTAVLTNTCMAYSQDGSILAVAQSFDGDEQQPILHYIDSLDGMLAATKSVNDTASGEHITAIAFLDRYLVAVQQSLVQVSDLVTDSTVRRFSINRHRTPLLSVSYTDSTFAIAAGKKVAVHNPENTEVLYEHEGTTNITAVLSANGKRGYTLLFEDATIRTLAPTTASHTALALLDEAVAPEADASIGEEDVSMLERADDTEDGGLALPAVERLELEEEEDDRPVVRPQQLAGIFDVPQSYAMPPVKDMFDAVVGLFGRRSRVVVNQEEGMDVV